MGIARMRQATRPSLHRFASRRNSADERSRRVNSIAWAIIPSCESNPTHSESEQLRQGNLTTSHDFGRLVLHAAKINTHQFRNNMAVLIHILSIGEQTQLR